MTDLLHAIAATPGDGAPRHERLALPDAELLYFPAWYDPNESAALLQQLEGPTGSWKNPPKNVITL